MKQFKTLLLVITGLFISRVGLSLESKSEVMKKEYTEIRKFFVENTKRMTQENIAHRQSVHRADKVRKEAIALLKQDRRAALFHNNGAKNILVNKLIEMNLVAPDEDEENNY